MDQTISVISGDGIGPEIMTACLRTLAALDCNCVRHAGGWLPACCIRATRPEPGRIAER